VAQQRRAVALDDRFECRLVAEPRESQQLPVGLPAQRRVRASRPDPRVGARQM